MESVRQWLRERRVRPQTGIAGGMRMRKRFDFRHSLARQPMPTNASRDA
jgi:hypothetical protein